MLSSNLSLRQTPLDNIANGIRPLTSSLLCFPLILPPRRTTLGAHLAYSNCQLRIANFMIARGPSIFAQHEKRRAVSSLSHRPFLVLEPLLLHRKFRQRLNLKFEVQRVFCRTPFHAFWTTISILISWRVAIFCPLFPEEYSPTPRCFSLPTPHLNYLDLISDVPSCSCPAKHDIFIHLLLSRHGDPAGL
jgi:hypothetical protein